MMLVFQAMHPSGGNAPAGMHSCPQAISTFYSSHSRMQNSRKHSFSPTENSRRWRDLWVFEDPKKSQQDVCSRKQEVSTFPTQGQQS